MSFLLMLTFSVTAFAINPVKDTNPSLKESIENGKQAIDNELESLMALEKVVREENLNFEDLQKSHPTMANEVVVSPAVDVGILDGSSDSPLGIPGFWWGFCLGWVGLVIVYVTMDEGSDRKEQVKNGLYGCIVASAIWAVFYFAVIVSTV